MSTDKSIDDPFLPLAFSLFSNPGAYAVLAGAGVSRGAGLPTAWDIVVDLVSQMAGDDVEINSNTAATWYEEKYEQTPTYSDVVGKLALTPTERQALLRKYFEPSDAEDGGPPGPSVAHRAIARLMQAGVIQVVLTMNFDRLFEQALRELQIEPTIIATEADAQGLAPLHTVRYCVIHLHGDYLNATSMRNTAAELSGYGPHMNALLTRVLTDYGLLVAGWSVQHDHALRDAVTAHYPSVFTMGWVAPGRLSAAASAVVTNKKALVLPTTADDAFGHLADQVESMRERRARHPLSLSVAVSRIKRDLSQQRPAIAAHDMLAAELTQLRSQPAFHLARYMDSDETQYRSYLRQIYEASRIPAASIAALAYWGDDSTDAWWLPDVQRLARAPLLSGTIGLIELPLIAGSILFYAAGVASVAGQRFALLPKLFSLRGNRSGKLPQPLNEVLAAPTLLTGELAVAHYEEIMGAAGEALGIGMEPIDDALQTFDVLRLCAEIMNNENFQASVDGYALTSAKVGAMAHVDQAAHHAARTELQGVIDRVGESCRVYGSHILAQERTINAQEGRRWHSPVAERLAQEVQRAGEQHPLVSGMQRKPDAMWLALKGVSAAVGRRARELEWQATPVGRFDFIPDQVWLDTGRPPASP